MPRYFFHTHVGDDVITDEHGSEHRDTDAAWEAARTVAGAAMTDPESHVRLMTASLVVMDEADEIVFEFPFAEAVMLSSGRESTVH